MAKILIVDDSTYARRVHRGILENAGHTVIEASTGTSAIETFSLEHPDAVLLDLSMEDIGGIEVLRTLRQLEPQTCIIVVSADIQRSTSLEVMSSGATAFIPKPANPETLLSTVAECFGESK